MGSGVVVWIRGAWGRKAPFLFVGCWRAQGGSQHWAPKLKVGGLGPPHSCTDAGKSGRASLSDATTRQTGCCMWCDGDD